MLAAAAPDACEALSRRSTPALAVAAARVGELCRVEAVARPRPASRIGIELWLPPPARWSGRYYQMGNGGFAGWIDRETLRAAAARGDAAAATDTGHRGDGFDARWARGRPDLVEDYGWRSVGETARAARALAAAYYGRAPARRYFMGCSFGGRQALVAASRWPAEWDGVIAGAPAAEWTAWLGGMAALQAALRPPGARVSPQAIPALKAGAARPSAAQRRALRVIERAGYPLADADPGEWRTWILDPDPAGRNQARFVAEARHLFAGDRRSVTAALAVGSVAPFLRRGGKLLAYVGTADAVLPPARIVPALRSRTGVGTGGSRLALLPGMGHCQGGPSPAAFGQSRAAPALADDADHDLRRALEAWVEQGRAPRRLIVGPAPGRAVALLDR